MNILRWHRKSKKKISLKKYTLFIFSLIMTTFAWFAYSKLLNTTINLHVAAWDINYYIDEEEKENPIGIEIANLYPTMEDETIVIDIENNGEALVDLDYHIESIIIAGTEYELVTEGNTNQTDTFVELGTPSLETDPETGESVYKGAIINDLTKFPFTVEVEHSAQVIAGGDAYLKVTVKWAGNNDELDSKWGYIVGKYFSENPTATSTMSVLLSIDSYQANEIILAGAGTLPSSTGTRPYLPSADYSRVEGTDLNTGLIIEDKEGNEYIWIEVPKLLSIYSNAGINVTEFTDQEYTDIETDLKAYVSEFKGSVAATDTYYSDAATGLSTTDYTALKKTMLKSVYQNGGFYVAKYEAGADAFRPSNTSITGLVPKSQPNKYPISNVTCTQAQQLASSVASGSRTSSLLFGIQWDLILKYMKNKGIDPTILTANSTSWGNYNATTYGISDENVKYSENNGSNWFPATSYSKGSSKKTILTTGALERFSKQNIFDFAGNTWEWTLEYSHESNPCVIRGGSYNSLASENHANIRNYCYATFADPSVGFRVSIY